MEIVLLERIKKLQKIIIIIQNNYPANHEEHNKEEAYTIWLEDLKKHLDNLEVEYMKGGESAERFEELNKKIAYLENFLFGIKEFNELNEEK